MSLTAIGPSCVASTCLIVARSGVRAGESKPPLAVSRCGRTNAARRNLRSSWSSQVNRGFESAPLSSTITFTYEPSTFLGRPGVLALGTASGEARSGYLQPQTEKSVGLGEVLAVERLVVERGRVLDRLLLRGRKRVVGQASARSRRRSTAIRVESAASARSSSCDIVVGMIAPRIRRNPQCGDWRGLMPITSFDIALSLQSRKRR